MKTVENRVPLGRRTNDAVALAVASTRRPLPGQHLSDASTSKAAKTVRFGSMTEKENSTTKTGGLENFRQSIRSTLKSPRAATGDGATPVRLTTTPQQQLMTPNSLLTTELEQDDEIDESLLCSPAALNVEAPRQPTEVRVLQSTKPPLARPVDRSIQRSPLQSAVQKRTSRALQPIHNNSNNSQQPTKTADTDAASSKTSLWSTKPVVKVPVAIVAVTNPSSSTPFTPRGVCMDLSGMFMDAASTQSKRTVVLAQHPTGKLSETPRPPAKAESQPPQEWTEKQCDTFSNWLNFTLLQEDADHTDEQEVPITAAHRTLLLHQRMASVRYQAQQLFQSSEMERIRHIIHTEIARGRISIRDDRDLYADLVLRRKIVELLLSYSTPWLRLGLETLFGQPIVPDAASEMEESFTTRGLKPKPQKVAMSRMALALKKFIIQRVLSDEVILAKYTKGKCNVPSGTFETKYQTEMRTIVVYRLVVLFIFLDRAKEANILDKLPQLFHKNSKVKSSQEVLLLFCRDFLKAEGSFVKHLARVGLKVTYRQEPIEEVDFRVANLAVDLRDGVRLGRMTEILTGVPRKSILSAMRLPAVSRLQKLHNVGLALKKLQKFGVPVPEDVIAHHIVDGHREMVLKLMWAIVSECCLHDLVKAEDLEIEIRRIERSKACRGRRIGLSDAWAGSRSVDGLKELLLRWCSAVGSIFDVTVNNLTTDMADGKMFCLLIHYYHPTLLRLKEVKRTTRDIADVAIASEETVNGRRANELSNSLLASSRLSELGGIPKVIPICDTLEPPDEKSVLLCLSFMCSRLLESRGEVRACFLIQQCYRRYRKAVETVHKIEAAKIILGHWRRNKARYYANQRTKYGMAVTRIESFVIAQYRNLIRLRERRLIRESVRRAATLLQAHARVLIAKQQRDQRRRMMSSSTTLQAAWRRYDCRRTYRRALERFHASVLIQRAWRQARLWSTLKHEAATTIQRVWKGFWCLVQYHTDLMDVVAVQACIRRYLATQARRKAIRAATVLENGWRFYHRRKQFTSELHEKRVAIICQCAVRNWRARLRLSFEREAVASLSIQTYWRRYVVRARYMRYRVASVTIQAWTRAYFQSCRLRTIRLSCQLIQSTWRTFRSRRRFKKAIECIVRCQAHIRRSLAQREVENRKQYGRKILLAQSVWRGNLVRRELERKCLACVCIQMTFRCAKDRFKYLTLLGCTIILQSWVRTCLAIREARRRSVAVVVLQTKSRSWLARKLVHRRMAWETRQVKSALTIQDFWRRSMNRRILNFLWDSACTIQRGVRCWLSRRCRFRRQAAVLSLQCLSRRLIARNRVFHLRSKEQQERQLRSTSACVIQKMYRGYLLRREFDCLERSAKKIQTLFRGFRAWLNYQMDRIDVIIAQTIVRRWAAIQEACRREAAIILMQSHARVYIAKAYTSARLVLFKEVARQNRSSTVIQKVMRGHLARLQYVEDLSAMMIQKTWRCYIVHVDFMLLLLAVIAIQAKARSVQSRQIALRRRIAVDAIQRFVRQAIARTAIKKRVSVIVLMQSIVRGHLARSKYVLQKATAALMQKIVREWLTRESHRRQGEAAVQIQRIWRGCTTFAEYALSILAIITIQSSVRSFLACCRLRHRRAHELARQIVRAKGARIIQTSFRRYLVLKLHNSMARRIQSAARRLLSRLVWLKLVRGISRLQSCVRGFCVRRRRSKGLKATVLRIHRARAKAQSDPKLLLGNRTRAALLVLRTTKSLSELHAAICTLELSTRLSAVCCAAFAEAGAPQILFSLIRTCNRSLPHVELLLYILQTMANVARYDVLLYSMATSAGVDVFLDLVQMFRDKEGVFILAATLLERVVSFDERLLSQCSSRENLKRLKGVSALCLRKLSLSAVDEKIGLPRNSLLTPDPRNRRGESHHLKTGIRAIQRVIRMVDHDDSPPSQFNYRQCRQSLKYSA